MHDRAAGSTDLPNDKALDAHGESLAGQAACKAWQPEIECQSRATGGQAKQVDRPAMGLPQPVPIGG